MPFYDDRELWLTAMIKGREKSQIGRKNPPLTHTGLWGLLLVIGPNIQHSLTMTMQEAVSVVKPHIKIYDVCRRRSEQGAWLRHQLFDHWY